MTATAVAVVVGMGWCSSATAQDRDAAAPPLVNADCLGQGVTVTALQSDQMDTRRYDCPDRGAVLLDASRALQGIWVVVGGRNNTAAQSFG
ncbi:hypothetical protein [Streptomyces poonensis]|uniref:Secreted protein n=1 Tax=Streptomyces poonensis TaxID=68255 RepID=A0A918UWD3_9ACTN|nr:hypothetical protein [Streptomyces poonensis]GGZ37958.1 hypothetical protein GCM10010365_68420 [Streptomyces poonensis]GLJ91098.1 hypothetical protein GCM10017589_37040 [Streptomyces poonensis]